RPPSGLVFRLCRNCLLSTVYCPPLPSTAPDYWSESTLARSTIDRDEMRRCVLCGKSKEQVPMLILGLHGGICVECDDLGNDVLKGDVYPADQYQFLEALPKPKEIVKVLSQYVVGQQRANRA